MRSRVSDRIVRSALHLPGTHPCMSLRSVLTMPREQSGRETVATRIPSRVLITLLLLVLVGIGMALAQSMGTERAARQQVELTTDVLALLRRSLRAGLDAETGQRGFLLTDDESYLAPFQRAERSWIPLLDDLQRTIGDAATEQQAAEIARLKELARDKLAELRSTIDLAQAGRRNEALSIVTSDLGQRLMIEFRTVVNSLEDTEQALLNQALNDARVVEARTLPILIFLGLAVIALVLLGFWLERRTATAERSARDADAVRAARERSDLLARELNHRVKNLFAVIISLVSLSGRGQSDVKKVVRDIKERVHALSLAHAVSQGQLDAKIVELRDVLVATLEPYTERDRDDRVMFEGPQVDLPVKAVTPIGLVIHELATNAAKYGALSVPEGRVEVSWQLTDGHAGPEVAMIWEEHGGPQLADPSGPEGASVPPIEGFGSIMMTTAARQLGGAIEREWNGDGVRARLTFPIQTN